MTRKKVTLAYISNESERKASYKKRKKGLMKKVSELSTLCGVDACAIVYSQYDAVPEVWPSPLGAQAILARFRKLSDMDQSRKMVNQESFTRQRIKKAADQLRRLQKENRCRELEALMFRCISGAAALDDFSLPDAAEMGWVISQTLRDINARMEAVAAADHRRRQPPPIAMPPPPPPPPDEVAEPHGLEECFPWNLVQSPSAGGGGGGGGFDGGGGLGWDAGMVLPYPYIFNHSNSTQTGHIHFNH
ncbi:agamous-like MADS-box protein AGL80 [Salvia miltiorrhiza]|uniref:agamous-like MADS-box protein AGL80 n=1 Tax=Salvia miltiorrhiza TaxID=226208 RepID=UPI0025AC721F|nr:agamous-like MADS-box protein AGL80 [Salvia miltiorrhiza]